ncbi:shufflon system plasmid conjugative transfer pilus tip adhesin PilV [Phocaeicola coprophilus]|uniref:shufflon system plasmid conjugative transfer pilus tip adhesin PilV n=1 Tax=Phocaeicola coprophilus TaxID=387090 RepID=UPI0039F46AE0
MPYHIDEENSELAFEVREGNKLVIKIKSNIFSDSLELYLIKVGDNTEPTDKNVFSSLRVLKEIENLHDTILKEINSVTSGFWELKQDSQGNEYIATKYNVLTEGGLTTYGLGEQKLGTIYDGLPIDNDTIYWEEAEGSRVLKAKGSGGGSTGLDETKLWNVLGTPGDQQIDYSHLRSAFSQFSNEFVTINTEQEITALKHFTAGLSIGSAKKKIYEKDGVLYIDSNVAITGALTMYATDGQSVSSIYDGLPIDNETIYWETVEGSRVLKAKGGSSFDENAMWSALSGSSNNQINKSHLTDALAGYATTEALNSVSNKLNDFLEGSDTDNIINKWKELEAFLSGMAETDNLAEILKTKADRSYVDSTFVTLSTKQTITGEKTFSSVLNTAAIKASGAITAPSLAVSDYVTIAGIKLRKLEDGALMLEGNLALTGALTMYASNGQSFDTIYDGLPIDNDTIYWQEVDGSRVLKAREGSGSSFDKSAMWNALAGSTTEQINKSHLTTALTGYATESWVSEKNYAVKATTLAGYGITDAYTKTDSDSRYINASGDTMTGDLYFNNSDYPFFNKSNSYAFYNISVNLESWSNNYFYPVRVTSNNTSFPLCTISISSTSGSGTLPLNNNSIRFMVRSGGWSDIGKRLIVLDHWAYSSSEITIYAIYLGEENGDCVVYLRGGVNYTISISGRDWISSSDSMLTNGNERYPKIDLSGNPTDGRSFARCYRAWAHSDGYGLGLYAENSGKLGGVSYEYFMRTKFQEGYYGMALPDGSDNNWIRTSRFGIIPYSSEIKSSLGTGLWQFGEAYIETVHTITTRASDWFRSTGNSGWINETYGGGWYMTDSTWIRAYNNKSIAGYNIQGSGKVSANSGMYVYGLYGSSWASGDGAYGVAVPSNENQTTLLLAYNGTNNNTTGSDRYFSIEVLNTGDRNVRMIVQAQHIIDLLPSKVTIFKDLLVEGGGTFYSSDIRYKSIIRQIKLSLSDIAKAPSFVYHWNKEEMNCNRLNLGGSAQYTQSILPWAVEENNGFLSMDYATVAYTFSVHTARHLLTYETRTDKKIKKLENRVKYLEKQLKKLGYEEVRTLDDQSV